MGIGKEEIEKNESVSDFKVEEEEWRKGPSIDNTWTVEIVLNFRRVANSRPVYWTYWNFGSIRLILVLELPVFSSIV